ncbi:MAG: 50S ribosomal protein L6 [Phototrophicales bacterium]|nr:MAG: 50S ribosomal protein L6 [Phototrophicales bacterium]
MSRIGKMPIPIPNKVTVTINHNEVTVKGPKGELKRVFNPDITIRQEDDQLLVERPTDLQHHRALHGLTRALLNNMVVGVSEGFEKVLEIEGVGYRAELQGKNLVLHVGYSHPVVIEPSPTLEFDVPKDKRGTVIIVKGIKKEEVGQVAAVIRGKRPPEPYLGKGIRYQGEHIRRKAGKSGKK